MFASSSMSGFSKVFLACVLALCALAPQALHAQGDRGGMPGDFDYYLLSLSWSPTYCSGRERAEGWRDRTDDDGDRESRFGRGGYGRGGGDDECSAARPYAFVLHGLWPQYERKGWPEFCEGVIRPWVPGEIIDSMMDIMPSKRLVINEYKKHGVCSGLEPSKYFESARQAYRSIHIPEEFRDLSQPLSATPEDIKSAFLKANSQLTGEMVQIVCSRDLLREVRVCLSKDLNPRPCSRIEQNRRLCTYSTVTLPPVRGGGTGPHGGPSSGRNNL
jgi:ribonuclease T2